MTSSHSGPVRDTRLIFAIGAIVLAVLALSLGDAVIKLSSTSFSIWQIYVLRSLAALPILFATARVLARRRGDDVRWSLVRPGWVLIRSLLLVSMWFVYYSALPFVPLSIAAAAYYTLPLFIVLLASVFLGERIGAVGWFAVVLGFVGALVILGPDADGLNLFALLPVVAALFYAFAMILTRTKCRNENPMALSLVLNLTFVVVGVIGTGATMVFAWSPDLLATYPFLFGGWSTMTTVGWLAIGALGAIIVAGSVLTAMAYQIGPASVVSVFDYAYLGFAALWGVLFFGEVPDGLTIGGMVLIAVAGVIAARR